MAILHPLIVGNWKMHGDADFTSELTTSLASWIRDRTEFTGGVVICPPFPWLSMAATHPPLLLGAQDCHAAQEGAYTGDVSAFMLKAAGCQYVILGHSERREYHHEDNALIRAKVSAALDAGLTPILCVGESLNERQSDSTIMVITTQLQECIPAGKAADIIIAYEPLWAIGSGKVPSLQEIDDVHQHIAKWLMQNGVSDAEAITTLYGGSVKPANAAEILGLSSVQGVLVGGASLTEEAFTAIIAAAV